MTPFGISRVNVIIKYNLRKKSKNPVPLVILFSRLNENSRRKTNNQNGKNVKA